MTCNNFKYHSVVVTIITEWAMCCYRTATIRIYEIMSVFSLSKHLFKKKMFHIRQRIKFVLNTHVAYCTWSISAIYYLKKHLEIQCLDLMCAYNSVAAIVFIASICGYMSYVTMVNLTPKRYNRNVCTCTTQNVRVYYKMTACQVQGEI